MSEIDWGAVSGERLGAGVATRAPIIYTDGSQRQVLYVAAWLIQGHRSEEELCERLAPVFAAILPERRKALLERELAKLKKKAKAKRRRSKA